MSQRAVQLKSLSGDRRIALVEGDTLRCLSEYTSVYEVVMKAIELDTPLIELLTRSQIAAELEYDPIYNGLSEWSLLPPFDHPTDPAHCLVTGTGLTHRKSADNRNAMHSAETSTPGVTDSMRIYNWGAAGGRPVPGTIGVMPEWFYKGTGDILQAHRQPIISPSYAEDGGEEAEVAGVYCVGSNGNVYRVGFAIGNEFSDHVQESRNYLYLAPSKLRLCSLGPEIVIGSDFEDVSGKVSISRDGTVVWSQTIATGENALTHSLSNLEHHHFKYAFHRKPGDVHIHYFGTPGFSFGSNVVLKDGDEMTISFAGMGRPLINRLSIETAEVRPYVVSVL